ncbi:hypothetical protein ABIE13_003356 [Ottowia thiooxydans]|uniref:Uncharacterized protein n=1 Tax=Ottowia thiooxydans TaxID=219182 RepID=A0ABV2QB40_9BURK
MSHMSLFFPINMITIIFMTLSLKEETHETS